MGGERDGQERGASTVGGAHNGWDKERASERRAVGEGISVHGAWRPDGVDARGQAIMLVVRKIQMRI